MAIILRLLLLIGCLFFACCTAPRDATPAASKVLQLNTDLININTATVEQLTKLPGVGETLAQKIVEFRQANGHFRRCEYLMLIDGIGEKRFREIKPYIRVE